MGAGVLGRVLVAQHFTCEVCCLPVYRRPPSKCDLMSGLLNCR